MGELSEELAMKGAELRHLKFGIHVVLVAACRIGILRRLP
jgi:hypothetical protein